MHRKTNLFYTSGPNSKFLTFSNYTESLTGNFLSTDTKIYPSIFLCFNIPTLDNKDDKEKFIKHYLVGYYENKLAALRDNCIDNNIKAEDKIKPLNYLLETIIKYCEDNLSGTYAVENGYLINKRTQVKTPLITYVGDITEQDYNGTYTDTICTIDFNSNYKYEGIEESDINNLTVKEYYEFSPENIDISKLYGWQNDYLIDAYTTVVPIYEYDRIINQSSQTEYYETGKRKYNYDSKIKNIKFSNIKSSNTIIDNIQFNLIVPLFDVTNINYHTKSYSFENIKLYDEGTIDINGINNIYHISLESNKKDDLYRKNVPLGIWFAEENIVLQKDNSTGFSQNWSLLISSQFKPFPYSNIKDYQDDTSNSNAFPTFAMVLSRQNEILDQFRKISKINQELSEKITALQGQLNNKATESNIDKIKKDFLQFEYEITNKYNSLKQEVKEFMENLAWKATE